MPDNNINDDTLVQLRDQLRQFCLARGWQDFHNPKNLTMALIVEAAELVEHFQWRTPEESATLNAEDLSAVRDELADVLIYLIELADVLKVDLHTAVQDKLVKNAIKYPQPN